MAGRRPVTPAAPISAIVAANIRQIRKLRRITQEEFIARMEESGESMLRGTLANIETGRRVSVTVDELAAFAAVLAVEPWSLTGPFVCPQCKSTPPAGFICATCGAEAAS